MQGPALWRDLASTSSTLFEGCFCNVVGRSIVGLVRLHAPINVIKGSSNVIKGSTTAKELFNGEARRFERYHVNM